MIFLAAGCLILLFIVWGYRRAPGVQRGRWRVGSGLAALALVVGGALAAARGGWWEGLILAAIGLAMAGAARSRRGPATRPPPAAQMSAGMSPAEARSILGVGPTAGAAEIQAAYARLMQRAHPDLGGTTGLAAQINAARDRLLKG